MEYSKTLQIVSKQVQMVITFPKKYLIRIVLLCKSRCCKRSYPFETSERITYQAKNKDESLGTCTPKHACINE